MAWVPTIPTASQFISVSQPLLRDNFQAIDTWSKVDHYPIDSAAALNGKHKVTHLVKQAVTPGTLLDEIALFCGLGAFSGDPELYLRRQSNGQFYAWTEVIDPVQTVQDGFFYLAGGKFLVKFNYLAAPGAPASTYSYVYTGGAPAFQPGTTPIVNVFSRQTNIANSYIGAGVVGSTSTDLGFDWRAVAISPATAININVPSFFLSLGSPA